MPKRRPSSPPLGARERQIMDAVYQLGAASVAEVRARIPDPPSYSSVRTMLRLLESKGLLTHKQEGKRYLYRARQSRESAARSAIQHVLQTFFGGSQSEAVAALLGDQNEVSESELQRIEELIEHARKGGA